MGMPQSEFWQMTPREFANASEGYRQKVDAVFHTGWEQARWVATVVVNVNSAKKRYEPQDLIKFPWEEGFINTDDELEKLKEMRKWRQTAH